MNDNESKSVKVRFAPGETGWGKLVEPGRVMIANIPMTDRLNIDDLVVVSDQTRPMEITRVLKRNFEGKTAIDYPVPHRENYAKCFDAWRSAGMKCEGMLPGLALVAHHKDQDPLKVAVEAGVAATLHDSQPDLEPITIGSA